MTPGLLASLSVGPIQFQMPVWLWLIPATWALSLWIGRQNLSGLATGTRRAAMVIRLLVLAILAGAMAEPNWRTESKDVAVTAVIDASRSVPMSRQRDADRYIGEARAADPEQGDLLGLIKMAEAAYITSLPSRMTRQVETQYTGPAEGTDLAGAVRSALGARPQDAAYRIVMITDGNETTGNVLQAAEAAKAAGVPIDVLPVQYSLSGEVLADQLVAPATARMGENITLRVVLDATKKTTGSLNVTVNGDPLDLDPDTPGNGIAVSLNQGRNVLAVPVTIPRAGPQRFEAFYEPAVGADGARIGDEIAENNRAMAVTFVSGQGRTLVVSETPEESEALVRALTESRIATEVIPSANFPQSLAELNAYDAIILVDQESYGFSQQSQEDLRQYVHDTGGGLLMTGGPRSFGAGGWIGSTLEDALPIRLDPPQKRQMPRGALALVMHSIEMPDGRGYGIKTAQAAVDALSRLDLVGINEYDPRAGGSAWVFPMAVVGDRTAVKQAINRLQFGDMPDYTPSIQMAYNALINAEAGARHVIMISDGDAQPPPNKLLDQYRKAKITISTVGVYPHSGMDMATLRHIAEYTGGTFYSVTTSAGLTKIFQIFIKEAQTVRRSLIWEGQPFSPAVVPIPFEPMRGVTGVPAITGYVVAADREGPVMVTLRGKENDPILAAWQHGLGRVITFTSDVSSRWASRWVSWPQFRSFWEQQVRWVMRPSGSANAKVTTETEGDSTKIIVEMLDQAGERLNFARFKGRVALPGGGGADVELHEVGMGRYEGRIDTHAAGMYVTSLNYAAPNPAGGPPLEGSVQAAITRPFADEFRSLTDNTPLLRQVAAMTGGRVLEGDPKRDDLWRREGLTMPVALRSLWLAFALSGIAVFLLDVAVRRVRIDVPAMASAAAGLFGKSKARAGQKMDSLRAAREIARRQMAEKTARAGTVERAATQAAPPPDAATAERKFEAPAKALRRGPSGPVALGGAPEKPGEAKPKPETPGDKEDGLSRLRRAKKRAQDEMGESP
ncbi:MAG: VWA domain-containing protein [Phycisphaerales bacterium]|nr:VWA domain-containing protein [Phycisphaerales bacterium]